MRRSPASCFDCRRKSGQENVRLAKACRFSKTNNVYITAKTYDQSEILFLLHIRSFSKCATKHLSQRIMRIDKNHARYIGFIFLSTTVSIREIWQVCSTVFESLFVFVHSPSVLVLHIAGEYHAGFRYSSRELQTRSNKIRQVPKWFVTVRASSGRLISSRVSSSGTITIFFL